jgi:hypothetical protein
MKSREERGIHGHDKTSKKKSTFTLPDNYQGEETETD